MPESMRWSEGADRAGGPRRAAGRGVPQWRGCASESCGTVLGQHAFEAPSEVFHGRQHVQSGRFRADAGVEIGDGGAGVTFEPAEEVPDLRGGHGTAESGLFFQIGEGCEENPGARVVRAEEQMGAEGKPAEQIGIRSQDRGNGVRGRIAGGVAGVRPSGLRGLKKRGRGDRPAGNPGDAAGWHAGEQRLSSPSNPSRPTCRAWFPSGRP